ncbi:MULTISPECIES: flagellar motor protein MotD [Rhodanobacter]|uniref:flagellar motor protein MotD n=1 Tax=Rhodanobacter TaxID=75309 RepID=UPI000406501C|nr:MULTISPECIES: flagellar motor protein MotD [Rhodanobacter]TAN16744.1 MAG: flagellar motor protein MotD [Rhodanobacter sp.]UJJ54244.1 flagellar motor protein MotD [Rhodanobacter thiooxydans]
MRRRRHEEHQNHEAWAIPYADLMTLLLAFFVVMYAVSVVNEGKFRVMSESLIEAFNGSSRAIAPLPPTKIRPHNIAPAIAAPSGQSGSSIVPIAVPIPPHPVPASGGSGREAGHKAKPPETLGRIEDQVRKALQPLIDRKLVVVRHKPDWLEIEIRTDILFPSGVAQLSEPATEVLHDLAAILASFGNPLRVEGFTDDMPISNTLYPSNWELSAARAASVARLFSTSGIAPARLGIIGWGETRPIADNATVEGRNQNRRVVVVVMSDHPTAPRDHAAPENVGQLAGLADPPPTSDVLPTVRVTSGEPATARAPADAAGTPAPSPVAGSAHQAGMSK